MIKIIDGNLLNAQEDILGHQVNALGAMGSGVAKFIKGKYSEAFYEYKKLCNKKDPSELLGMCQIIECHDGKKVANLFGQAAYGYGRNQYTDISALRKALEILKSEAKLNGYSVALPYKVGSCRGGAKWEDVYSIIENVFHDYDVSLYRLDLG